MYKTKKTQEQPQNLKRKLSSALAMLLIATILMTSSTYAWLVLSTAPEVTGITTNVGANGSLEIALLNAETYTDLSAIRSGVGDSVVANNPAANNAWGNLVDLGYQEYGLSDLTLLPSRLMVSGTEGNYTVDSKILAVPVYGYDGRVVELEQNTFSAVYQDGEFAFQSGAQDYGVRAFGTSDAMSVQGGALATAKANIPAYIKSAKSTTQSSLGDNGEDLLMLVMLKDSGYGDEDMVTLDAMVSALDTALTTIDNTLRQGLIAYAASEIGSEDTFNTVRAQILAAENLGTLVEQMGEVATVPTAFNNWVSALADMQNDLNNAKIARAALNDGEYTWAEVKGVLDYLMNMDAVYLGDRLFTSYSTSELMAMQGQDLAMKLPTGSGIYADIADFVGNYSAGFNTMGMNISISTLSAINPSYLNLLNTASGEADGGVQGLTAADGGDEAAVLPLDATYGYAIDLAFRCNAADPDLVLQTSAVQRVYTDSDSGSTQGGGSYMAFSTSDENMTQDQMLALMDALRVAFVDAEYRIMAVAKPNITTAETENSLLKAPLYLYDFTFEPDETGALLVNFGERRRVENLITDLDQNVAKAVTAVVWLDGDIVDNTMVSATEAASLNGLLNLQFATNARLIPAEDASLFDYAADASVLEEMMDPASETYEIGAVYEAGQGTYTSVSWNRFVTAYDRASFILANNPGEVQIRDAAESLAEAYLALEQASKEAITEKVAALRLTMGTTDEASAYVVDDEMKTSYTGDELASWTDATTIYSVDYTNNNLDGEEGVQTPIYTDGSWTNLASALYYAEYVSQKEDATEAEIDAAMTQLESAEKELQYQVAFLPYEYKETIYYKTSYDADAGDVYGDWYDSEFNRIYSEVMMMTLEAYAEPATMISVNGNTYVRFGDTSAKFINITAEFLESVYPELREASVKGIKWEEVDSNYFVEMMASRHYGILTSLLSQITEEGLDSLEKGAVDTTLAVKMLDSYTSYKNGSEALYTAAEVDAEIARLETDMEKARDRKAKLADAPATQTQITLLSTAITSGDNYISANSASEEETVQKNVADMTAAVASARQVLEKEDLTYGEARTAISEMNDMLLSVGLSKVTAANTIVYHIPDPVGSETIVYDSAYTDLVLKVENSGTTTLTATILSADGVVSTASKQITIYDPADGVKCYNSANQEITEENPLVLDPAETVALSADIYYRQDLPGVVDKTLKDASLLVRETVEECIWASGDMGIVTVNSSGVVTAMGRGTTTIRVSVRTEQGNTYVLDGISVTVNAPANP